MAVQTRLQSVMAVTIGLQQAAVTLSATSAFRTQTLTAIQRGYSTALHATSGALVKMGVSANAANIASKALMGTLTLGLSVAITGIIMLIDKYRESERKKREEDKKNLELIKQRKEAEESMKKSAASTVSSQLTEYKRLQAAYKALGDDIKKKKKFVDNAKSSFDNLGISVKNVSDAENLLINNESAFIKTLNNRALAAAAMEMASEKYKGAIEKMMEAEVVKKKPEEFTFGDIPPEWQEKAKGKSFDKIRKRFSTGDLPFGLTESNFEERVKERAEKGNKTYKKLWDLYQEFLNESAVEVMSGYKAELDTDISKFIKEGSESTRQAMELMQGNAGIFELAGFTSSGNKDDENKVKKAIEEQKRLQDEILHIQYERENLHVSAIKDEGERVRKQIEVEYQRRIDEVKRQEKEWKKAQSGTLRDDQQKWIDEKKGLAEDTRVNGLKKIEEESQKAQLESIREYLKEYGTFQQKKLAIAEEYAEKIRKAEAVGNEGEVKSLKQQQQIAVAGLETAAIKAEIDWQVVFGEFGSIFKDAIKTTLDKAERYIRTDEFKNAAPENQKGLIDAVNQMKKSLGGSGGLNFRKLSQDVQTYQASLHELNNARDEEIQTLNELKKAQKTYEEAIKNGTEEEKKVAKEALDTAKQNADSASGNVKTQAAIVNQAQQNVSDTATNLKSSMENVIDGLSKLSSGGLRNSYDGFIQASKLMGGAMGKVAESLESVPIIGWILSIIDILKDGLSNLIGSLLDAIFNAVGGIIHDILSGDLFVTILDSVKNGIGKILNAISFGGWNSLMDSINGGNAKEVNAIIDKLTTSNKYLITAIDKLTAEMSKSGGAKATEYYESALEKQKQKVENDRQMLEAKMGYHSAHHSNDYYINDAFSADDWKIASDYIGKNLRSAADLWKLSPEDLAKLQELPEIWDKINKGKYDQSDWLDEYINDAGTLLELTEQWQDAITNTSFDNIRSEMKSLLADFKSDSKSVIASVDEFMKNAILDSIVSGTYSELIREWQSLFADAMKDGILTATEADFLRNRYQSIFDQAIADRDADYDAAGIKDTDEYSQSGRAGTLTTISQDTGNELKGLFTSVQMHVSSMDNNIANFAQVMYQAMDAISELIDNTSYCKYLEQINERLERAERDGWKIS
ncbi:MAG: hypothetical protein LBU37_09600 [Tannerellaceae bacterium]|nr:hypothetical protein [Tannerellaceae bacterium]